MCKLIKELLHARVGYGGSTLRSIVRYEIALEILVCHLEVSRGAWSAFHHFHRSGPIVFEASLFNRAYLDPHQVSYDQLKNGPAQ